MLERLRVPAAVIAAAGITVGIAAPARAQGGDSPAMSYGGLHAGTLTCNVASGWGFVFGSTHALNCTFAGPGRYEHYIGNISRFGLDIGYIPGGAVVWSVLAPNAYPAPGSLAGPYAVGPVSSLLGIATSRFALIGGYRSAIALEPIRFEGGIGLNVASGISAITLAPGG